MTTATKRTLDYETLRRDIRRKMEGPPRVSYREAARQIKAVNGGEGPMWNSLAQVVSNGRAPDYDHYVQICNWLGVPPEKYAGRSVPSLMGPDYVEAALLRRDEPLSREKALALSDIFRVAYNALAPPRKEKK